MRIRGGGGGMGGGGGGGWGVGGGGENYQHDSTLLSSSTVPLPSFLHPSPFPLPPPTAFGRRQTEDSDLLHANVDILISDTDVLEAMEKEREKGKDEEKEKERTEDQTMQGMPVTPNELGASIASGFIFVSGRLGERYATLFLRKLLIPPQADDPSHSNHPNHPSNPNPNPVINVVWVNYERETGQPFDIIVYYRDGSRRLCEVKTRTIQDRTTRDSMRDRTEGEEGKEGVVVGVGNEAQDNPHLWPISGREVAVAQTQGRSYFCVLVDMVVDHIAKKRNVTNYTVVGYTYGLMNELGCQLFLQVKK